MSGRTRLTAAHTRLTVAHTRLTVAHTRHETGRLAGCRTLHAEHINAAFLFSHSDTGFLLFFCGGFSAGFHLQKICLTYFELCQTYFKIQGTYFLFAPMGVFIFHTKVFISRCRLRPVGGAVLRLCGCTCGRGGKGNVRGSACYFFSEGLLSCACPGCGASILRYSCGLLSTASAVSSVLSLFSELRISPRR